MADRIQELTEQHEAGMTRLDADWQDRLAAKIAELVSHSYSSI